MRASVSSFVRLAPALLVTLVIGGCAATPEAGSISTKQRTFGVAMRQLPPEPPYNRLRWVHLPETLPSPMAPRAGGRMTHMIQYDVTDIPLEEAAHILAASHRYQSFAASTVATSRVSLRMIGTLEEVASSLAEAANASVYVDHEGRSIRFVSGSYVPPRFFEEGS